FIEHAVGGGKAACGVDGRDGGFRFHRSIGSYCGFWRSHPSRKNKNAARVGHPHISVSHPFRKEREKDGARKSTAKRIRSTLPRSHAGHWISVAFPSTLVDW